VLRAHKKLQCLTVPASRSATCKHLVFAIAVLTTRIFVWVAIDRFQKSSDGAKPAKRNSWKSWTGAVFDTSNDMRKTRVTAHDPHVYLDLA